MSARRWLPLAGVGGFAAAFVLLNRGETVALNLGFALLPRLPLAVLLLLFFLLGMLATALLSLRHDRRVRDVLRRHGLLDESRASAPPRPAPRAVPDAPAPASDVTLPGPLPASDAPDPPPPAADVTLLGPLPASDAPDPPPPAEPDAALRDRWGPPADRSA